MQTALQSTDLVDDIETSIPTLCSNPNVFLKLTFQVQKRNSAAMENEKGEIVDL